MFLSWLRIFLRLVRIFSNENFRVQLEYGDFEFCYEEFIFDLRGILKFIYEFLVVV